MAQRVIRQLVDDIDGTDISEGGQTVEFSFRGIDYRLDLSEENLSKFERAIGPYVDAAERASNSDENFSVPASRADAGPTMPKKASDAGRRSRRSSSKTPSAGNRSRKRRQTKESTPPSQEQRARVRAWGNENGHQVSARGRISREVIQAFEAAHAANGAGQKRL